MSTYNGTFKRRNALNNDWDDLIPDLTLAIGDITNLTTTLADIQGDIDDIEDTNIGKIGNVSLVTLSSAAAWAALPVGTMVMINSTSTGRPSWVASYMYIIKTANRDSSGGYSVIGTNYATGEIMGGYASTNAVYPTWLRNSFQLEDGDGTEVTISPGKELKFIEGGGIDINFTDTSTGSDADPFDLTFTLKAATATVRGGAKISYSGGAMIIDIT